MQLILISLSTPSAAKTKLLPVILHVSHDFDHGGMKVDCLVAMLEYHREQHSHTSVEHSASTGMVKNAFLIFSDNTARLTREVLQ